MSSYQDPIVKALFDLIDASDGGAITSYFYGDPFMIPRSKLPALIGSKDTTEIGDMTTAEDEHKVRIVLTLVTDIRDNFGDTAGIVAGWQTLYDIIEGRGSDFKLKSTSLVDILRTNANLGNQAQIDVTAGMVTDYGLSLGKRGETSISVEANLIVPIYFSQLRE